MKMLSRYAPICCYRSSNSLQLFGFAKCLQQITLIRLYSANITRSGLSAEKELGALEKLFQERVNNADLCTNEENLAYCLELVDIWLQNSLLDKAE